jgi:hypothetical protein
MATYSNIYIDQGSTYSSVIDVKDGNGLPFNLTGYSSRGQIRKSYSSNTAISFTTNINLPLQGKVQVLLIAAQTRAIKAGRYVYDIEIYNSSGHVLRISEGQVEINPGITDDNNGIVLPPVQSLNEIIDERIDNKTIVIDKLVSLSSEEEQNFYTNSKLTEKLSLKAPLYSPIFTGTVSGITKSMVGLSAVDNTSDVNKPISIATQTALNTKVNAVSGQGLSDQNYTAVEKNKLDGIAAGAEVNVNADWSASGGDAQILNKPTTLSGYGITDALNTSATAQTKAGNLTAASFIKSDGLSTEFLKADGTTQQLITGKTIYVDAGVGTDTRNVFSKYDSFKPFATISAAVAASAQDDLIYVRAGSYTVSAEISLNLKGHLYFETGTTVSVATGVTAFSYSQNNIPIYIKGSADFVLAGSAGVLTIPSGSTAAVAFECNTVSGPNSASGTLFNCAAGVLSVDIKVVQMTTTFLASSATVFNVTGAGKVTTQISFVYCGVFVNGAGAANAGGATGAQINADVWTIYTYNATAGMNLSLITTNFRIVNYNHVGVGAAFSWTENTTFEGHVFQGVTWSSAIGAANMTFTSTNGSTTNKRIYLGQTNTLRSAATNSLSSSLPIDVYTHGSFATAPANSNVTFRIGTFTVNASA